MTPTHHNGPSIPTEDESLSGVAARLAAERPLPSPSFRGDLRRLLLGRIEPTPARPRNLRALIAAYAGSGFALLAVAAVGIAGAGPFAA